MGAPVSTSRHNDHRRGQNINDPTWGSASYNNYRHTRLCLLTGPGYSTPITFPRWRHRREARQGTESRPPIKVNVAALRKNPIQWHHDLINVYSSWIIIRFNLKIKSPPVIKRHDHATIRHAKHTTQSKQINITEVSFLHYSSLNFTGSTLLVFTTHHFGYTVMY